MIGALRALRGRAGGTLLALVLALPAAAGSARADGGAGGGAAASAGAIKAAFLYNFAMFAEWPALPSGAPIVACVVGDDEIAAALVETVRGRTIGGHAIEVWRPQEASAWHLCQVLFIADAASRQFAGGKTPLLMLPVLTVSDAKGFSLSGGVIELYVEGGRIRFAINTDAAERSGLRLSSRLLGLARVVRDGHAP